MMFIEFKPMAAGKITRAKWPLVLKADAVRSELFNRGYFVKQNMHTEIRNGHYGWADVDRVVMYDSDDAVELKSVKCWVTKDGDRYVARSPHDEHMARRYGSTHIKCDCGEVYRSNAYCRPCSDKKQREKFEALEAVDYSEDLFPICTYDGGKWFYDESYLKDYVFEAGPGVELIDSVPVKLSMVEVDQWCDELPEDYDESSLPESVQAALLALNDAIHKHNESGQPCSYWQGKRRVVVPESWHEPIIGDS